MSSGVGRQTGVKFTTYKPQTNHSQGLPAGKGPAFYNEGHPRLQRHLHSVKGRPPKPTRIVLLTSSPAVPVTACASARRVLPHTLWRVTCTRTEAALPAHSCPLGPYNEA